jgi:hypothetical protein
MSFWIWTKKEEVPVVTIVEPIPAPKPKPVVKIERTHVKTDTIRLNATESGSYYLTTLGGYSDTSYSTVKLADLEEFCRQVRRTGAEDDHGIHLNKGNVQTTVDLLKVASE